MVYARAYAEQIELMKKLGKKSVINAIAEQNGINRKQIYRYLRLNYLIPELQKWVEDKECNCRAERYQPHTDISLSPAQLFDTGIAEMD